MVKGFPMRKTIFVVILSGKNYKDSRVLNGMMNKSYADTDLLIINRGPNPLQFDKDFIHSLGFCVNNIDIKESIGDRPLGEVCNNVISNNARYERFIFCDDDSILNKEYIKRLDRYHQHGVDLQIPSIRGRLDGRVYYPIINESVCKAADGFNINTESSVKSLGLGLVIYRSLIEKFSAHNMGVFDNQFAINGCDTGFFSRLDMLKTEKINVAIQVVNSLNYTLVQSQGLASKWRTLDKLRESFLSVKMSRFRY
jgi:hypothetical protein